MPQKRINDFFGPPAKKPRVNVTPGEPRATASLLDRMKECFKVQGTKYGEVLLNILDLNEFTRVEMTAFTQKPVHCDRVGVPMDAFLTSDEPEWADHCPLSTEDFNAVAGQLLSLGITDKQFRELTKPSGPKHAALLCLWHYATRLTAKPEFGMTGDRTNSSVAWEMEKIEDTSTVRTQDVYLVRADYNPDGVQWHEEIPENTEAVLDVCHQYAAAALKESPYIIVVGKHASELADSWLQRDKTIVYEKVPFVNGFLFTPTFGTYFGIVRDRQTLRIQRVVFFLFHGMYFTKASRSKAQKPRKEFLLFHDLVWNAVCEWAGIPVAKEDLFSNVENSVRLDQLHTVLKARAQEKATGVIIPRAEACQLMARTLAKREWATLAKDVDQLEEGESAISLILRAFTAKGLRRQATEEWKQSEAGQNMATNRLANMKKGQQTRATEEWKQSEAGRKAAAALHANLVKARQVLDSDEYKQSEASRKGAAPLKDAKNREAGMAIIRRRRAVVWENFMASNEVQSLLARPEAELNRRTRRKQSDIRDADATRDKSAMTVLMSRYGVRSGDRILVSPGLQSLHGDAKATERRESLRKKLADEDEENIEPEEADEDEVDEE